MARVFLFSFCLVLSPLSHAQLEKGVTQSKLDRNNISIDFGYAIIAFSASLKYELLVPTKKEYLQQGVSIGLNLHQVNFFSIQRYILPSLRYGLIFGERNHYFDLFGGVGLLYDRPINSWDDSEVTPVFNLGYRNQKPDNGGYIFRTGVGYPELLYISFGVSF